MSGIYELQVQWNGRNVRGSPFKVTVDSGTGTPADLIGVDASTLKLGIINEEVKTLIDTRKAGPGTNLVAENSLSRSTLRSVHGSGEACLL